MFPIRNPLKSPTIRPPFAFFENLQFPSCCFQFSHQFQNEKIEKCKPKDPRPPYFQKSWEIWRSYRQQLPIIPQSYEQNATFFLMRILQKYEPKISLKKGTENSTEISLKKVLKRALKRYWDFFLLQNFDKVTNCFVKFVSFHSIWMFESFEERCDNFCWLVGNEVLVVPCPVIDPRPQKCHLGVPDAIFVVGGQSLGKGLSTPCYQQVSKNCRNKALRSSQILKWYEKKQT